MSNDYFFNASDHLKIPLETTNLYELLVSGLAKVKAADPRIIDIAIACGSAVDLILGLVPRDIDIHYVYSGPEGGLSRECHCDYMRRLVTDNFDSDLLSFEIDLDNINEYEPVKSKVAEKSAGLFAPNEDHLSTVVINYTGEIWANHDSVKCINTRTYELRFEGLMQWLAFRDVNKFYMIYCNALTRGLSYHSRKNVKLGDRFMWAMTEFPFALQHLREDEPEFVESYIKLFKRKIGSVEKLKGILNELGIENREEIVREMKKIVE